MFRNGFDIVAFNFCITFVIIIDNICMDCVDKYVFRYDWLGIRYSRGGYEMYSNF